MKSGEELYSKTYQSLGAAQRVVLKTNLNYERQDTISSDARKSFDHSDKHGGTYRETVVVKWTSGSKDCPTRLSKNTITSANRQLRN